MVVFHFYNILSVYVPEIAKLFLEASFFEAHYMRGIRMKEDLLG